MADPADRRRRRQPLDDAAGQGDLEAVGLDPPGPLLGGQFVLAEGQAATGQHIADLNLTDNTWTEWTSPAFVALLQQMADGSAEPSFKVAPNEQTGWGDEPTHVQVEVVADFDLNCPPL